MGFHFNKEYLDLVLVPSGVLIIFGYHIYLLYIHLNDSESTIIGLENKDKKEWIQSIVGHPEAYDRAINVISCNTNAATYLAMVSLTLCTIIGTWLIGNNTISNMFQSKRIYGDTNPDTIIIKDVSLLVCLLIAFTGFIQSARHLVHANYLLSSPNNKNYVQKVEFAVIKGGNFWLFSLRALCFALVAVFWFFGPIPMFISSVIIVITLYYHDICTVRMHNHYISQKIKTQEGLRLII